MSTDRRLRYGEAPTRVMLAIWALVTLLLISFRWKNILSRKFSDPDDSMRLVQVRDLLNGQGWFDLHQYRLAPPEGVLMHWSRIVDAPLYVLIGALRPIVGQWWAEQIVILVVPAALFLIAILIIGRISWRLLGREASIFACLSMAMLPMVLLQFLPMRIDHHAYQVVAFAAAVWALSWRHEKQGAAVAGLAMGFGLLVSLELLPFAAILGLVLFSRWLRDHRNRWMLVAYMQALAGTMVLLFLLTRGTGDLAPHCDVVAPAHLGFFLIAALGTGLIASVPRLPPLGVVVGFAIVGVASAAFFYWNSPLCVGSPFGQLDPIVERYWYQNVLEGQPLWKHQFGFIVAVVPQLFIALGASLALALRNADWLRRWWFEYSAILFLGALAALFTTRSLSIIATVGAVPIGWLAAEMFQRWSESKGIVAKLAGALGITVVLVPASLTLVNPLFTSQEEEDGKLPLVDSACYEPETFATLGALDLAFIVAPIDLSSNILEQTHHSVLATGHHRAQAAMADLINLNRGEAAEARAILERHRPDYILFCKTIVEGRIYGGEDSPSFAARLYRDDAPSWLQPVDIGLTDEAQLYRYVPANGAAVTPAGSPSPPR